MKQTIILCYLSCLLALGGKLQGQTITFSQLDNLNLPDGSMQMIETENGNFVSAGYWENEGWLAKFNPCGAIIWMKRFQRGNGRTLLWEVMEIENGDLIAVGQAETPQTVPNSPDVISAFVVRTDACGNILHERQVNLPTTGLPLGLLTPTAAYGVAKSLNDGIVITGQNIGVEISNLSPVEASLRKTVFLFELDSLLNPIQFTDFPHLPQQDSLVAYQVQTLRDGYAVTGSYRDPVADSIYLFAAKTDSNFQQQWLERWDAAPPDLFLTGSTVDWSLYHTATALDTNALGELLIGGSHYRNPFDFLDAFARIVDPSSGSLIDQQSYPNLGLDLALDIQSYDQGVLLSGGLTFFDGVDWTLASSVWETQPDLSPAGLFTYTDSTDYYFLATSILPLNPLDGDAHAFAGQRYLPGIGQDTSASIIFVNAQAQDQLPETPLYYGGVIVQIEDVNIRDTILCRPASPPDECLLSSFIQRQELQIQEAFPVPSGDWVTLKWEGWSPYSAQVKLMDAQGRTLQQLPVLPGATEMQLSLEALPVGRYWVHGWEGKVWQLMKQ